MRFFDRLGREIEGKLQYYSAAALVFLTGALGSQISEGMGEPGIASAFAAISLAGLAGFWVVSRWVPKSQRK